MTGSGWTTWPSFLVRSLTSEGGGGCGTAFVVLPDGGTTPEGGRMAVRVGKGAVTGIVAEAAMGGAALVRIGTVLAVSDFSSDWRGADGSACPGPGVIPSLAFLGVAGRGILAATDFVGSGEVCAAFLRMLGRLVFFRVDEVLLKGVVVATE